MFRKPLIALSLATLASGAALANDITPDCLADATPFVSTATREQVKQELLRFKQEAVTPQSMQDNPQH